MSKSDNRTDQSQPSVRYSNEIINQKIETLILCESTVEGVDRKFLNTILKEKVPNLSPYYILTQDQIFPRTRKGSLEDVRMYIQTGLPIEPFITQHIVKTVLVIVDADKNPQKRFEEIRNSFSKAQESKEMFNVPNKIGDITSSIEGRINVGIYLFPDSNCSGSIETLLYNCIQNNTKKQECIERYMECLRTNEIDSKTIENKNNCSKAQFRIYYATSNPDRFVDSVIAGTDFTSEKLDNLQKFLETACS